MIGCSPTVAKAPPEATGSGVMRNLVVVAFFVLAMVSPTRAPHGGRDYRLTDVHGNVLTDILES